MGVSFDQRLRSAEADGTTFSNAHGTFRAYTAIEQGLGRKSLVSEPTTGTDGLKNERFHLAMGQNRGTHL